MPFRTPSPSSSHSQCGNPSTSSPPSTSQSQPQNHQKLSTSTSPAGSTRSTKTVTSESEHNTHLASSSEKSTGFSIGRLKIFRSQSSKRDSVDSGRSDDAGRSPATSRPTSPQPKSPQRSRSRRLAGFASRSIRKSQWRLFKHRTFFGSIQRGSVKNKNQLQPPKLTLRHPSVDSAAIMPLDLSDDGRKNSQHGFLQIRKSNQRRWTETDTGRLRDSRDSSDFHDSSHDTLDVGGGGSSNVGGSCGGGSCGVGVEQSMTAPVSPNVPLSASSSHSDGWKYSSQKLLWKLKPKYMNFSHASSTSSSTDSAWKSLDSMTWRSLEGMELVLRGTRLENLSEIERSALQIVAAQRLTKLLPGVNFGKPKDHLSALRQKRQKLVKANRAPTVADVQRRASGTPCPPEDKRVFGVSLAMCMLNEKRLDLESRCRSLDDSTVLLQNSNLMRNGKMIAKPVKSESEIMWNDDRKWLYPSTQNLYPSSTPTSPSALTGGSSGGVGGSSGVGIGGIQVINTATTLTPEPLIQQPQITGRFTKKTRAASASFSCSLDASTDDIDPHALQVPRIVENCTQYLMTYGLNQVGLFRVAGNTKRCRQLRNALEKVGGGHAINDNMVENTTAHDVATLLKEYFRDLPQSLLPKEHYQAYIAAAKLNIEDRIEAIRLLFALLVSPNLDTLFVLLKFLHEVSCHSNDRTDENGEVLHGNKMDGRNLATIFAPSILRADHDKLHEHLAENDQQCTVVETMISNVEEIFNIPRDLQSKIYNKLKETEPERLDRFLYHLSRMDSHDPAGLLSPFPVTLEEDVTSPRLHRSDHSHIGRQSPLARELTTNGKVKVQSQRSGSWPFSLIATTTQTSPNRPDGPSDHQSSSSSSAGHHNHPQQHFFPSDSLEGAQISKSASATPSTSRRGDFLRADFAAEIAGEQQAAEPGTFGSLEQIPEQTIRGRAETMASAIGLTKKKKAPHVGNIAGSKSVDARSPSRERVDDFRSVARSSASAARRRIRNVIRAFRLSSVARSSPDIAT
ncbi:unnamed protein product [Caenorhabditis angaria]|uniref:Rho-GAP domain-containing protein n=1 Tax=Caenorhabditis angaria TaxID=860376 RepID=A0A9P1MU91_9PELO|nr:unnamed protein product [Caenorhabditis angaria]